MAGPKYEHRTGPGREQALGLSGAFGPEAPGQPGELLLIPLSFPASQRTPGRGLAGQTPQHPGQAGPRGERRFRTGRLVGNRPTLLLSQPVTSAGVVGGFVFAASAFPTCNMGR